MRRQGAGNFFGRPAAAQGREQGGVQRGMGRDRAPVAPGRACAGGGALLGGERPVVVATAVEREFAAERAGRAAEALRDEVLRGTPAHGAFQFDALGEREVRVSHRTALGRRRKFGNAQGPRPAAQPAGRGP